MRRVAFAAVVLGALALSAAHWVGLLVGGIAVGLLAGSWSRALGGGAAFGVFAWLVFLGVLADAGRLAGYLDSGLLVYVSLGIPVALGVLGSLSYGLTSGGGRSA